MRRKAQYISKPNQISSRFLFAEKEGLVWKNMGLSLSKISMAVSLTQHWLTIPWENLLYLLYMLQKQKMMQEKYENWGKQVFYRMEWHVFWKEWFNENWTPCGTIWFSSFIRTRMKLRSCEAIETLNVKIDWDSRCAWKCDDKML